MTCLFQLTIPLSKLERVQRNLSWEFGEHHGINAIDKGGSIAHVWVETTSPRVTFSQHKAMGAYVTSHEYPYIHKED